MKILMIDSLVNNDYTFWLCRGLSKAQHEVELVTVKNRANNTDEPFVVLPVSPNKGGAGNKFVKLLEYILYLVWLFFHIARSRADVVHFQFFRRERIECLYFPFIRLLSQKLIFTAHNIIPHEHTKLDIYLRYLVYKSATKIIVHTPSIKQAMLEMFSISEEKVFVVPAVLPISEERDASITKELSREKLNLSDDDQIILFFGYIREYKGLDILLKAFDSVKPNHKDLKLIVAGRPHTPELLQQYTAQIDGLSSQDSIIFIPEFIPDEEVDFYFRAADIVAVPYKQIYLSGVLQVAFSYGKPILATNVGNFKDLIISGENGYITNQNTVEEFAEIINLAFQNVDYLREMGHKAYEIHESHPDWQEIGTLTIDVYEFH